MSRGIYVVVIDPKKDGQIETSRIFDIYSKSQILALENFMHNLTEGKILVICCMDESLKRLKQSKTMDWLREMGVKDIDKKKEKTARWNKDGVCWSFIGTVGK